MVLLNRLASVGRKLLRQKKIDENALGSTKLDRCLTTFDLTALGKRIFPISKNYKTKKFQFCFEIRFYMFHRLMCVCVCVFIKCAFHFDSNTNEISIGNFISDVILYMLFRYR